MCNTKHCCKKGGKCNMAMFGYTLLLIGGLNWGLVGLGILLGKFDTWNVINMLLSSWPTFEGLVYLLVGIAAIMALFGGCKCRKCKDCVCVNDQKTEEVAGVEM